MKGNFEVGIEDVRTLEEKLSVIVPKLDLYEFLMSQEYVSVKFDDSTDEEREIVEEGMRVAGIDFTLNINNDYVRILRLDSLNKYKYAILAQIDMNNITHETESKEVVESIESLAKKIESLGLRKDDLKTQAESKYLIGGAKT